MNKEWGEKNKEIQKLLGKEATYQQGIEKLIEFRAELFETMIQIENHFPREAFDLMPFAKASGYHSKTLGYSIWHIFRIEDIVAHELIARDAQILFQKSFQERIGAPMITTGNELKGDEISAFSRQLDIKCLLDYAKAVMRSTNEIIKKLEYQQLKRTFTEEDKKKLEASGSVSADENAVWLIDYWCNKDVRGLLKMPFSRHWIMHIEAMLRIENKILLSVGTK
ncbi:MAG: phage head-tail adapter protein [bacterium]|nr:phage head-tail adapter protein [bacterium]